MSSLTGKRWPIVGKRIHAEFPYIDAEVSPAISGVYIMDISMIVGEMYVREKIV